MAAAANAAGADRIFLMGYDYHWPGSEPGASAPMDRLDGEDHDLPWSLDRYAALGVPAEKTILGLPLYGYTWPVSGPGIGAPSLGRGDTWVPRRNLRVFEDESFEPEYNATEGVEFYSVPDEEDGSWDAVYYDSPRSLTPKLALANERGLAGAGFWAIGYERGLPGYTKLIKSFRERGAAGRQARGVARSPAGRQTRPRCSLGERYSGWQTLHSSNAPCASHPMPRAVNWLAGRAAWRRGDPRSSYCSLDEPRGPGEWRPTMPTCRCFHSSGTSLRSRARL